MPKYAANLTWLYQDLPLLARVGAAAEDGFEGVEILFPYETNVRALRDAISMAGLEMVLINCPPPNHLGGEPGWAAQPAQQDRFRRDFERSLRFASVLKPQIIHIMSGAAQGEAAKACLVENLAWASAHAPDQMLTIEVINQGDMPGYFLSDYDQAAEILDAVDAPNLKLQFDTYHADKFTGDAGAIFEAHRDRIGHIQVGNGGDRHEPGATPFDHPRFLEGLEAAGYQGWVSGEHTPKGDTSAGLSWRL